MPARPSAAVLESARYGCPCRSLAKRGPTSLQRVANARIVHSPLLTSRPTPARQCRQHFNLFLMSDAQCRHHQSTSRACPAASIVVPRRVSHDLGFLGYSPLAYTIFFTCLDIRSTASWQSDLARASCRSLSYGFKRPRHSPPFLPAWLVAFPDSPQHTSDLRVFYIRTCC